MNCKLYTFLILFALPMLISFNSWAQKPDWSVDPKQYANNMNIVGFLKIAGIESDDENDIVSAFINNEVRGVASPIYIAEIDRHAVLLTVLSNGTSGEISFKIYDASEDRVIDAIGKLEFKTGGFVGGFDESFTWSDVDLNSEAFLESFRVDSQLGETEIDGFNINIETSISLESPLNSKTATWVTSEGAELKFNNVAQESGKATYDFSSPLVFQVQSEDQLTVNDYTVTVNVVNQAPEGLEIDNSTILENASANLFIGQFSTTDNDENDTHTYSLMQGEGDDDNALFKLSGNSLISNTSFNFEKSSTRKIRVSTTDEFGESFEKALSIEILDVNDIPQLNGSIENQVVTVNNELNYTHVEDLITDPDVNDELTLSMILQGNSELPSWMTYNSNERTFTALPTISEVGDWLLRLTGTDESGESISIDFKLTVSVVAGLEVNSLGDSLKVYPNPSKGIFNIDFSALTIIPKEFRLISPMGGKVIFSEEIFKSKFQLDLSRFPSGIYLLEAFSGKQRIVKKVLIQK